MCISLTSSLQKNTLTNDFDGYDRRDGLKLMYRPAMKWKCALCGGGFYDGEVFAIVSPALYNAELNDVGDTGKRENFHYECLEKKEGKR